ncbi:hypothetical protein [Solemya velum gill symbiont]|uniref:hypothetical protein n=1 Tax=Solemya velum gill symbiont TaxID=2340 RepID=UPI0009989F2E|nr:hypothetical protein [Solemya velum gill symbiont]OOZ45179.1 hypothetical protein BOW37_03810 [Solemya velum gill symbiont]OOZ46192.1 hypothetical protein BOW38_08395 [Solemya velum gill symbiont]OOZ49640.1 hypothetical protein BOW39_05755 [Solemya velum gill symbiont]OOZ51232.1 hypothetical protein BOW40_08425 [Solemya velum gill symbiont]OOZ53811.1 hypothetical protein BOW41_08680 [Solemya velum gill symbiont]
MSSLVIEIPTIADQALGIMKRVIDENEKTQEITDQASGPLPLASALSDFFQLASGLEQEEQKPESEAISELGHYTLDLLDRLASQIWHLDIHDQRDNMARLFVSLAVWFARHNAVQDNLQATADSFAILVNGEQDSDELANLSRFIDEVLESASDEIKTDEDKSDPWRPWRVLNLNSGVAATRALDTQLMQTTFEHMERRLPYDLPGFFADGKRQMESQDVPEEVNQLISQYAEKWPFNSSH